MSQLALSFETPVPKAPRTAALRAFVPRDENVEEALAGNARGNAQEQRILQHFRSLPPGARRTPWEIHEALGGCINSTRRALSLLVDRGELVDHRTDRRPSGPFGSRSRTWSLPE